MTGTATYDPMKEPRYTEIATFMRAPLSHNLAEVDIGLIGVPTDLGVTNRPGARHGPREIRNSSSLMRTFNLALGVNPYELCRIADLGDVRLSHRFDLERQVEEIAAFYREVHAAGVRPVSAGGDHSITYPIFKALAADAPIGMVHIDAHCDTWGEFYGSKFTHGAPFRLAVEDGLLDPKRTIQIGIRGGQNFMDGIEFSKSHGMRVVFMEEFTSLGVERVIEEACRARSRVCAGHRHAGSRRDHHRGGAAAAARSAWTQSDRRRCRGSRPTLRSDRQHRPRRRNHDVRNHLFDRGLPLRCR
jgi:guanidinopropionase